MKICTVISPRQNLLFLVIVLLPQLFNVYAQSERVVPKLPAEQADIPKESKPKFVPDPNSDRYKIVFLATEPGRIGYTDEEAAKASAELQLRKNAFVEQLNKVGEQGYRVIPYWTQGISLVRLENVQYEYSQIEIDKLSIDTKGNALAGRLAAWEEKGFSIIAHTSWSICDAPPFDPNRELPTIHIPYCTHHNRILMQRVKTLDQPNQFWLAQSSPGKPKAEELTALVNEGLATGFAPTHIFSKFQILMQKTTDPGELAPDKSEVLVLTAPNWRGGDKGFQLKVNELAQTGYRLALIESEIALLYRRKKDTTPTSYIWIDAKKKNFDQQLAGLQAGGAIFQMTYPNSRGEMTNLIFQQGGVGDGKQREYKVLKLELNSIENVVERKVVSDLSPASKEEVKRLNRLAQEGFEVCSIFTSGNSTYHRHSRTYRFSLLLERVLPDQTNHDNRKP